MAQSADDLLGPPSADELLGPQQQPTSVLPAAARWPLGVASAMLGGVENTIGLPGDIQQLVAQAVKSTTGQSIPPPPTIFGMSIPGLGPMSSSSDILSGSNALGLTNNPLLAPQSTPERFAQAAAGGVGSALPMLATGGSALPILAGGLGGGIGAEAGHEAAPDSSIAPVLGGLLGGVGLSGATGTIESLLDAHNAQKAVGEAENALATARENAFYGRNTNSENATAIKQASAQQFTATKQAAQLKAQQAADQATAGTEQVASKLGQSTTYQQAGQVLQAQGRNWLTNTFPAKEDALWQPVEDKMSPSTPSPLNNFVSAVEAINKKGGNLQPLRELIIPRLPQLLQTKIGDILENPSMTKAVDPTFAPSPLLDATGKPVMRMTSPGKPSIPLTWADGRILRSTLGDAMGNPEILNSIGEQNLKHLYAANTADLRSSAQFGGALDEFDHANTESTKLRSFAENVISKVTAGGNPLQESIRPEDAAKAILAKPSDIAALRAELPGAADELGAAHLRSGAWAKSTPEAKAALVSDPKAAGQVDGLLNAADVAKQQSGDAIKAAQASHAANQAAASAASKANNFQLAVDTRKAAQAYKDAKNALSPAPSLLQHVGETVGSGMAGDWLGTLGLHMMPGSDLTHGAIGGMLGLAGPALVRGLANSATRPQTYRNLAATVGGATNQLAPIEQGK